MGLKLERLKRIVFSILALAGIVFTCTSCIFLFGESFGSRDSLDNVTTNKWTVTPKFVSPSDEISFKNGSYSQRSESFFGFQAASAWSPFPILTNIVVKRKDHESVQYSLSASQISKLREVSGGEVRLVLYDEGLGCMSPTVKSLLVALEKKANQDRAYCDMKDRCQILRNQKSEVLNWTAEVLTNGIKARQ